MLFLAYFKCWINSCYAISRYNSFLFLLNVIEDTLFYIFMHLQVRAGDNLLMCWQLMVVIILLRFFCFINIGYQLCKVIFVITSCTNNSKITLYKILCNSILYEKINFIMFLITIIFATVNLVELVPFCFQNINVVSKILI